MIYLDAALVIILGAVALGICAGYWIRGQIEGPPPPPEPQDLTVLEDVTLCCQVCGGWFRSDGKEPSA